MAMIPKREDYANHLDFLIADGEYKRSHSTASIPINSTHPHNSTHPPIEETRFGYKMSAILAQISAMTLGGNPWYENQGPDALERRGFIEKLMSVVPPTPIKPNKPTLPKVTRTSDQNCGWCRGSGRTNPSLPGQQCACTHWQIDGKNISFYDWCVATGVNLNSINPKLVEKFKGMK